MTYLQPSHFPILTLLVLSPLVGMLLAFFAPNDRLVKRGAVAWSLVPLALAVYLWAGFDSSLVRDGQGVVQFVERVPWIDAIHINYFLGVDGISLPLVILTALMTPIAMLASFNVTERVKAHYALLFLLEAAMLGYFVALDFFFFFIFWEFSLVPAYFLIQSWGRDTARRGRAAMTFFVYTVAGSLGMLLLFQLFYVATDALRDPAVQNGLLPTFDLITLGRLGQGLPVPGLRTDIPNLAAALFEFLDAHGFTSLFGRFPLLYASLAFWAIFIAFAIKLGVWPFHTWLPDAYSEAPTSGSIMLASVMSKMGAYGMLRILLPFLPDAAKYWAPAIGALALISIVAGAFGALAQVNGDLKRLIAYTSVNHMGYVALAVAAVAALGGTDVQGRAIAINGALFQMVAHGLSTGALFLLAQAVYERTGTYDLDRMGGLRRVAPTLAGVMGVAMFANLGLPGLAGFVGEFFILRGVWSALPLYALLATIGLVVTALALLRMYGHIFNGPLPERLRAVADIDVTSREFLAAVPLLIALLVLGVYPALIMDVSHQATALLAGLAR